MHVHFDCNIGWSFDRISGLLASPRNDKVLLLAKIYFEIVKNGTIFTKVMNPFLLMKLD